MNNKLNLGNLQVGTVGGIRQLVENTHLFGSSFAKLKTNSDLLKSVLLQHEMACLHQRDAASAWRLLEKRIIHLKNDYNSGRRTVKEYWDAVAHCQRGR